MHVNETKPVIINRRINYYYAANNRVVFDLKTNNVVGDPDGMTIDTNGNLWVACFNSNHVSIL